MNFTNNIFLFKRMLNMQINFKKNIFHLDKIKNYNNYIMIQFNRKLDLYLYSKQDQWLMDIYICKRYLL